MSAESYNDFCCGKFRKISLTYGISPLSHFVLQLILLFNRFNRGYYIK